MGGGILEIARAGNILHRPGGGGDFQEAGRLSRTEDRLQGMADGCQMDPDLMRASRTQAYLKCCGACRAKWCTA